MGLGGGPIVELFTTGAVIFPAGAVLLMMVIVLMMLMMVMMLMVLMVLMC